MQLEAASVAILAVLIKVGNFRPKHLQEVGYPKRAVMRTLKRLINAGVIEKSPSGYTISPRIISMVRDISSGLEELDGLTDFVLGICYGESRTNSQVEECARRLKERGKVLASEGTASPDYRQQRPRMGGVGGGHLQTVVTPSDPEG